MKARDVMTSPVVTVGPDTTVREIAALLLERHISAVPVLEHGRLVGIVSEGDLLHRHEIGTDGAGRAGSWWHRFFGPEGSVIDYIKSHAQRAREVMTRDVVTVTPDTPLADVADLLEARGVRRVPVMDGDRLVGIVSRSSLLRALARSAAGQASESLDDAAIRARLLAELCRHEWWHQAVSNVAVSGGVVTFSGIVESREERQAARIAAENVPGVRRVEDNRVLTRGLESMT